MKLKDFKIWVNALSEQDLEKELLYNSIEYGISGSIPEIAQTQEDLFYVGDEPALLYTKGELVKRGFSKNDIADFEVEIPGGSFYIELHHEYSILDRFLA